MSKIKLGDRVKDKLTGFTGIAVAHTGWLHGCARIAIEPTSLDKDGKPQMAQWFDDERVVKVKGKGYYVEEAAELQPQRKAGGPRPDPVKGR